MKRITRLARTTSCQCIRPSTPHNSIFHTPRCRRISTTPSRCTSSKNNSNDSSSPKVPLDKDPVPNVSLSGFDGYHLPKAMPENWREKMEPYTFAEGDEEQEGEGDEESGGGRAASKPRRYDIREKEAALERMTPEQRELQSYIDDYTAAKEARMAADPRFRAQMEQFPDDFDGGDEPPYPMDGFWAMEEEKDDPGPDEPFMYDDITSQAHAELEQHRELRELARVIVWDMPLLWNHRTEYKPPTAAQALRFRYTTYLGEVHPAARKVVVDFTPSALPDLTEIQVSKLIKLLGVRYNPSTDRAKISCERFPNPAQNKRYLGDLIDKLVAEAKDSTDTFEDVPFDFRHHRPKPKLAFPEEWRMTAERRRALDQLRLSRAEAESQQTEQGRLVQGAQLVRQKTIAAPAAEEQPVPVPVRRGQILSPR